MMTPLQPLTNLQHALSAAKPALIDAMGVAALKFIDDNFCAFVGVFTNKQHHNQR